MSRVSSSSEYIKAGKVWRVSLNGVDGPKIPNSRPPAHASVDTFSSTKPVPDGHRYTAARRVVTSTAPSPLHPSCRWPSRSLGAGGRAQSVVIVAIVAASKKGIATNTVTLPLVERFGYAL